MKPKEACELVARRGYVLKDGRIYSARFPDRPLSAKRKSISVRLDNGKDVTVNCQRFAAYCLFGDKLFAPGTVVRSRTNDFFDIASLYLDTRSNLNRDSVLEYNLKRPKGDGCFLKFETLNYEPRKDPDRAVRENSDIIGSFPDCHWEVVWAACHEAARKYDPSKGVPLRSWMRWVAKNRVKDKMRAQSVRFKDDSPGYKLLRRRNGQHVRLEYSPFEETERMVC